MTIQVRSNEPKVQTPAAASGEAKPQAHETDGPAVESKDTAETTPAASGPVETEEAEGSEVESEGSEASESRDPLDPASREPNKKKGGFQRRIDKLNARVSAKEQELEYWKQQALKTNSATNSQAPGVEPAKPATGDGKPKPDSFDTHADYVEALTDWKTDQKFKELSQKQAKSQLETEQAKQVQTYQGRLKEFASKTPDFDDVIGDVEDIPLSPAVREIILTSDQGPELAYELAKNRDEYARICKLPPLAAARELGRLEAKISPKASSEQPGTKKITQAPEPLKPVNTGGKGSAPKSIFDPNLSQSEYERLRAEQIKKRRQA